MEQPWLAHYERSVPAHIDYPAVPLHNLLEESARDFPDRPAVSLLLRYLGPVRFGGRLTYRQLLPEVDRFAAALYAIGVRKGDRIALLLPNLPQFVIAFYGAARLGAVIVNNNPTYTAAELEHQFSDTGAETVILVSSLYARFKEFHAHTAIKRIIVTDIADYVPSPMKMLVENNLRRDGLMVDVPEVSGVYHWHRLLNAHPERPHRVDVRPDDPILLQFTGGTTGVPKAAVLTHRNVVANTIQSSYWLAKVERGHEQFLGAIPFFHVYGMTIAMSLSVYAAGELLIVPDPRQLDMVMRVIQREHVTVFPGVPAMYIGIINHPRVAKYNLRSIKACISGAAPLPMEVQVQFGEITGGRLVEGYGLTEAAPVTHCNPVYGQRKAGSIGLPLPDVEARIVDYETLEDQPVGQEGELWLRGPQVMAGYWNRPDETAKTITSDGWLRTGDIARMDDQGYFFIVDRLKDIIIASGFNIIPREVEEVLFQHPKVQDAVVAGVPDPYRGETVKAYLVLKPGQTATPAEIRTFCKERLAPYKVPALVEFRSELPKTMVGKVLRRALVEEETNKRAVSMI